MANTNKPTTKYKRKPNIRQVSTLNKLSGNVRKGKRISVKQAAIDSGYSPSYADTGRLTKAKSWDEMMEIALPDNLVVQRHNELLNSFGIDHMVFPVAMTDEDITILLQSVNCTPKKFMHSDMQTHVWYYAPDNRARKDALDMAYKLKGKFKPEKLEVTDPLRAMSDEQLMEHLANLRREMKR